MKKLQVIQSAAVTVLGVALMGGVAAAATTTGGPNSPIHLHSSSYNSAKVNTKNHVTLNNHSTQGATSGNASAHNDSTVGDVGTGDASNNNGTTADVTVTTNAGGAAMGASVKSDVADPGDVSTSGPNSPVHVNVKDVNKLDVKTDNHLTINNNSSQTAKTGNASVSNTTTGGNVQTGNASNTNSSDFTIEVSTN